MKQIRNKFKLLVFSTIFCAFTISGTAQSQIINNHFVLSQSNEIEPNDDFSKANMLVPNIMIKGHFGSKDITDVFQVSIPPGNQDGVFKFSITEKNNNYTPHGFFYNIKKTELENNYAPDSTTTPFTWKLPVTAGKKYYLKLEGDTLNTDYSANFEFIPVPDQYEPNNTFDSAAGLISGNTINVYMFSGFDTNTGKDSDIDFFKINVPEGNEHIKINLINKSTAEEPQNYHITLYNSTKTEIDGVWGDNAQADIEKDFNVTESGTFYLKISDVTNSTLPSQLKVTVE